MGHSTALVLLGLWGILELGMAGTLTLAFWFAWFLYAALLVWMSTGSTAGAWLVLAPPSLLAAFSGANVVPQELAVLAGASVSPHALPGAVLVTFPCGTAVAIHLWYAAAACKR